MLAMITFAYSIAVGGKSSVLHGVQQPGKGERPVVCDGACSARCAPLFLEGEGTGEGGNPQADAAAGRERALEQCTTRQHERLRRFVRSSIVFCHDRSPSGCGEVAPEYADATTGHPRMASGLRIACPIALLSTVRPNSSRSTRQNRSNLRIKVQNRHS